MSAVFTDRGIAAFRITASDESSAPAEKEINWQARWIMAFLVAGVVIRLARYLLRFPLWGDEAMLSMNLLDRDYAGLMQPLNFHQVAPLLFLWIELAAVKLLGFNEWSLRLFPLLCSIAFSRVGPLASSRESVSPGGGDFCGDLFGPALCLGDEALRR